MISRKHPLPFALYALLASVLVACGGADTEDLQVYVDNIQAQRPSRIEPLPEFKPFETFLYEAGERRSPFALSGSTGAGQRIAQTSGSGIQPDFNRAREPLEEEPLDALRMVGTLAQSTSSWALVRMGDGTIHRVQPGNYAGQNHGKIVRVTEYEIELTEIVPDGLGGWRERQASLALSE